LGYGAAVTEAGGTPVPLVLSPLTAWEGILEGLDGVLFVAREPGAPGQVANGERLCRACRDERLPFLGVDQGLYALNAAFGGSLHLDLARECPRALQHQHPPEPGDRHAIDVAGGTLLAQFYGEGEIVVNSEHRRAVCRVARGFRVSARALDGVIEAIEAETDGWFALGVQWHPASASASGLDIQLFRGLVEACRERHLRPLPAACLQAA
jgi:putative glutamine amidotransferase